MKVKTKIGMSIVAVLLAIVLGFVSASFGSNSQIATETTASTRTIELSKTEVDSQSLLAEFDNATLTTEGNLTTFEGTKPLDLSALSEIDNISEVDFEGLANATVKYRFTYDSEENVVTIAATAELPDGTVEVDEIRGVGFINENNEIDAVMNVDGEGILLSEMQNSGLIENCGWFSNLIKQVATVVAVTAVVVAAAAVVVATAGAAAPAVIAAGVGVTTTVVSATAATAATIAGYATITAAIAAGVYVGAEVVDKITYNGIDYKAEELTEVKMKVLPTGTYYLALATSDGKIVFCPTPISRSLAVAIMRANTVVSVYTYTDASARGIAQEAGNFMSPIWDYRHKSGYLNHYHLGNQVSHSACYSHAFYGLPVL